MNSPAAHWKVYWRGDHIGTVYSPSVDNFDICGPWRPRGGGSLDTFLATLKAQEEAVVRVGNVRGFYGFVKRVPDRDINIKYSVTLNAG